MAKSLVAYFSASGVTAKVAGIVKRNAKHYKLTNDDLVVLSPSDLLEIIFPKKDSEK